MLPDIMKRRWAPKEIGYTPLRDMAKGHIMILHRETIHKLIDSGRDPASLAGLSITKKTYVEVYNFGSIHLQTDKYPEFFISQIQFTWLKLDPQLQVIMKKLQKKKR
jgi:hypothetical protein